MNELTELEKRILAVIQHGFPAHSLTPYAHMASRIGIDTADLLEVLRQWQANGRIRRLGAIVNHFQVGMGSGAMVVWQVPLDRIEAVGQCLAGFKEVSHAYQRPSSEQWPYNLYTMVHGAHADSTQAIVERMSQACGITDYRMLVTEQELKKVPPTYIMPTHEAGPNP